MRTPSLRWRGWECGLGSGEGCLCDVGKTATDSLVCCFVVWSAEGYIWTQAAGFGHVLPVWDGDVLSRMFGPGPPSLVLQLTPDLEKRYCELTAADGYHRQNRIPHISSIVAIIIIGKTYLR